MNFKHFITKRRHFFVVLAHLVVIVVSYLLAFCVRFDCKFASYYELILRTIVILLVIKCIVFYYFQVFTSSLRYASVYELWQILKANILASICFIVILVLSRRYEGMPRSVFLLDWGICLGFTTALRLAARLTRGKIFSDRIGRSR
ncbi:MAG TPA: hypothetical protein VLJ10_04905, partial [Candidatus Bathyarchaeia archaeon]|nr:hypothetical protein [Candidatus Bathyarchaeia archaeon]